MPSKKRTKKEKCTPRPSKKKAKKEKCTALTSLRRIAKAYRKAKAVEGPFPELPEDVWHRIFEVYVQDRCGNVVVPALAQLALLSSASKTLHAAARAIRTPYDAEIAWDKDSETGRPVSFVGGVAFGEFHCCIALAIIRHAANGRMFVVSTEPHPGFERDGGGFVATADEDFTHVVKRKYSFCQLAHLLGGQSAQWEKRLTDFARLQYYDDEWSTLDGRQLVRNGVDFVLAENRPPLYIPPTGFVEPNKLESTSLVPERTTPEEHHNDFITYAVSEGLRVQHNADGSSSNTNVYKRLPTLMLFEEEVDSSACNPKRVARYIKNDRCWQGKYMVCSRAFHDNQYNPVDAYGDDGIGFYFKRPIIMPWHASDLSVALGLYSDPDKFEAWGLVSLFKHYNGLYELLEEERRLGPARSEQREQEMAALIPSLRPWHNWGTRQATLARMAELARAAARCQSTQADAPRARRGAAAKALGGMYRCIDAVALHRRLYPDEEVSDAACDSDSDYDARKQTELSDEEEEEDYVSDASEVGAGKRRRTRRAAQGGRSRRPAPVNWRCPVDRFLARSKEIGR